MSKKLEGKKILMVIAQENFRDEELLVPKKIFEDEGAAVSVAANERDACKGMLGASVNADLALREAKASDYDALVIPGGMGSPQYLWRNGDLHALIAAFRAGGKQTHSICLSPAVLAITGVLKGRRGVVYPTPESKAEFEKAGAIFVDEPVVTDGDIVTGRDPAAAEAFGKKIVEVLGGAR
jgi:protease I